MIQKYGLPVIGLVVVVIAGKLSYDFYSTLRAKPERDPDKPWEYLT